MIRVKPDNSPRFERKIIEKNERYTVKSTPWGVTQRVFNELDSTPENLNFYYNDSSKWEEAKKAMLTYYDDRIPWKYLEENYPKWKAEGRFLQLCLWFGFDVTHSHILHYKDVDRMPAIHFGYWKDLLAEWAEQGHISLELAKGVRLMVT